MKAPLTLPLLDPLNPLRFPHPSQALSAPDGLLAFGGDLSPQRLLAAYAQGIFPWFNADEPILWWSPDPRCVLHTNRPPVNRSLRKQLKRQPWRISIDQAFGEVVRACAEPRSGQPGTWIVPSMIEAYEHLHRLGHAHSVEVWEDEHLVGGIYGIAIGQLFCGESMFSRRSGGSRAALAVLARLLDGWGFPLIDAQVTNPHLMRLGAQELSRQAFLHWIAELVVQPGRPYAWREASVPDLASL